MKRTIIATITGLALTFALAAGHTDIIPWQTLVKYLPQTFNGLPMSGEPYGTTMESDQYAMSQASAEYGEDDQGTISIHNGQLADAQYQGMVSMAQMNVDSSSGYLRSIKVQDFSGIEQYDRENRYATVIISLGNSVAVILSLSDVDDTSACVSTAEAMDLKGLAALK
jgi:hypothetical protein